MKKIYLFIILFTLFALCACNSAGTFNSTGKNVDSTHDAHVLRDTPNGTSIEHEPKSEDRLLTPIPSPTLIPDDGYNSICKYNVYKLLIDFSSSKYKLPAYEPEEDDDCTYKYSSYVESQNSFSYSYRLVTTGIYKAVDFAYFTVDNYDRENPAFFDFSKEFFIFCAKQIFDTKHHDKAEQFINNSINKISKQPLKIADFDIDLDIEDKNITIHYTVDNYSDEFYSYIELSVQ